MRNIKQYPITKQEIVRFLQTVQAEQQQRIEYEQTVGDISALILEEAIRIVIESKDT